MWRSLKQLEITRELLYRAVDLFYEMQALSQDMNGITLYNLLPDGIQVFCGIETLAQAAGKVATTQWSGNAKHPMERGFFFCGVWFFQFKEDVCTTDM